MGPDSQNDQPSDGRRCACLKQQIRLAKCIHPEKSLVIKLILSDGYIEYCSDCDKVTSIWEP